MNGVVVVGAGWAGCAAAWAAAQAGTGAILLERTDLILGTGLVGGIMDNNGRRTARLELAAMGAGGLLAAVDRATLHRGVDFPGHRHASLYDVTRIEGPVRQALTEAGVEIRTGRRVTGIRTTGPATLAAVVVEGDEEVEGDAFVDATGTAGPMAACVRHGNGCALCILRCPAFGGRVSIAAALGVKTRSYRRERDGGIGAISGSCELEKESLSPELRSQLQESGVLVYPLPPALRRGNPGTDKACRQYALPAYADNLVFLDTGKVKLMTPHFPLATLRRLPGFEQARFADPLAGGQGNSVRFMDMVPGGPTLAVPGTTNVFVAGEKAGPLVGHTEALTTGLLAGLNASRCARGLPPRAIPRSLATGDVVALGRRYLARSPAPSHTLTFSGGRYFRVLREKGLYTLDPLAVEERVQAAGWAGVFG